MCRHCYVPNSYRKKTELKTKEIFSILGQLAETGCFYLGFTGGEPFMRKDIIDIFWYAKKKGFEIIIYTNGSLIDKKLADELCVLRPNKVDITIPAMSKGAFERITRNPGSHRKVFNAIDLLRKRGVNLGFKTCVLKENESEIQDIQKFAASLGALHRLDDMLSPRLDGSREPFRYREVLKDNLVVSRKSYVLSGKLEIKSQIDCDSQTDNQRKQANNLFKCGVGRSQAAITPQGELKMCLMINYPKYNILTQNRLAVSAANRTPQATLKEVWQKLKDLVSSIKTDENYQCNTCNLYTYCKWCPAKGWLYNRCFTSCEPESLKKAELGRRLLI